MRDDARQQRHLLVTTGWAAFGSFGLAFAVAGFANADLGSGLLGFALIVAAYVAHIIVNHVFGASFSAGEVALGFVAFVVSASSFALSWVLTPGFAPANVAIGLAGFAALLAVFVFYMVAVHGVRGSIALIDAARRPRRRVQRTPKRRSAASTPPNRFAPKSPRSST